MLGYQLEIGDSSSNVAAVLQAACYFTNYMPKG